VRQAGGAVHREPEDIPGVGRFAVVADPQGAVLMLFKDSSGEAMPAVVPGTPGHVGWHELYADDWPAALAFYADLFGWSRGTAVDMGPMGTYQLFACGAGGAEVGGMMNRPAGVPGPCWLYYFNVAAVDAAVARVTGLGGQVLNGPMQVPGGSWIVQCADPQGAAFALVGPTR
jgi:predicted enzyme related to lactoylglutathione lyase